MYKSFLVKFLIAIMVLGFVTIGILDFGSIQTVNAYSLSVPEFTIKQEAHPYYEPPVYEIDPYTGNNLTIQSGYHVENKSIVVRIKNNNNFITHTDRDRNLIEGFYRVRVKGHFGDSWTQLFINVSASVYTVKSYSIGENADIDIFRRLSVGDMVDFQVEAIYGHYYDQLAGRPVSPLWKLDIDEMSGFSETQTITISELQTPTPTPTSTPEQESFPTTIAVISIAIIVLIGLSILVYFKKYKKK